MSQSMLTPAMQGVIMAIAKARQVFDADGPEAGLIKVTPSPWLAWIQYTYKG